MAVPTISLLDDATVITPVAQVSTFTLNNDFNDSETDITITMTNEVGGTQTESITPTGTDESTIATALRAQLNGSTQSLFTAINWTVSTTVVTGTAKTSGVPFIAASAVTGGAGTITDATGTANVGPNDWNTATIWDGGSKPANDAHVVINSGSRDLKYGLNQSAVNLKSLRIGKQFRGIIGDKVNKFYLQIDVSATGGANTPLVSIRTGGVSVWLDGTMTSVNILGCSVDEDAIQLKGDIDNLRISGGDVKGTITAADAMVLDNVYVNGAPGCKLLLGESITSGDLIEMDSGEVLAESAFVTLNVSGGRLRHLAGAVTTCNLRGNGRVEYAGSGTLTTLNLFDGFFDLASSEAKTVTITNAVEIYAGVLDERGALANVVYSGNVNLHGGEARGCSGRVVTFA